MEGVLRSTRITIARSFQNPKRDFRSQIRIKIVLFVAKAESAAGTGSSDESDQELLLVLLSEDGDVDAGDDGEEIIIAATLLLVSLIGILDAPINSFTTKCRD